MAKAKMISNRLSLTPAEWEKYNDEIGLLDETIAFLTKANKDSHLGLKSFVGDVPKVAIMDALGLYNGEEL
jgi:hypothetical protein